MREAVIREEEHNPGQRAQPKLATLQRLSVETKMSASFIREKAGADKPADNNEKQFQTILYNGVQGSILPFANQLSFIHRVYHAARTFGNFRHTAK